VNGETTAAGAFVERSAIVDVTDGRLTIGVGGAAGNSCISYVTVQSAPNAASGESR
jgi:hypothetical protein